MLLYLISMYTYTVIPHVLCIYILLTYTINLYNYILYNYILYTQSEDDLAGLASLRLVLMTPTSGLTSVNLLYNHIGKILVGILLTSLFVCWYIHGVVNTYYVFVYRFAAIYSSYGCICVQVRVAVEYYYQ